MVSGQIKASKSVKMFVISLSKINFVKGHISYTEIKRVIPKFGGRSSKETIVLQESDSSQLEKLYSVQAVAFPIKEKKLNN